MTIDVSNHAELLSPEREMLHDSAPVQSSILIVTKNEAHNIEACLEAVYSQKNVAPFEVILVDSGSTDATLDLAQRFPVKIKQIPAEAFHHSRTRNLAASLASGEILVYLVADAVPASDNWLSNLLSAFDDPGVGAVYGRQFPKLEASSERQDALNTIYGEKRIVKDPAHRNGLGYGFYHFSDVNAGIRRNVWEAVQFPEDLKVFEDLGIAKRILDRGWKIVYEPDAAVFHSHSHTTLGLFKRYFDIGYTLKILKIWDAPGTRSSLARDAWKLLKGKFKRARDSETRGSARHGIKQDVAKSLGMFLGLNENCLPRRVKRRLSAFRVFE
jgi:rhamnosyltransferase